MICLYVHGSYRQLDISEPGFGMVVCGCSIEDTVIVELPDVICYNSDYSFIYTEIGPWIISRRLKRNTDGKEWKFSGNLNVPRPIVTIGDTIYIPSDYNVVSMGVDSNSVFKRQILK